MSFPYNAAIQASTRVRRFHTAGLPLSQENAHHTANMQMLALSIWGPEVSLRLMQAILYHDTAEYWVGDVPYPVKRDFPELRRKLDVVEEEVLRREGLYVDLPEAQGWMLRVVDSLECAWWARSVAADTGYVPALGILDNALAAVQYLLQPGQHPPASRDLQEAVRVHLATHFPDPS